MSTARIEHTATLLPNGKVLIAGGSLTASDVLIGNGLASAEIYDPGSKTFSATGSMNEPRVSHTATLLPSGKVLIAGGRANNPDGPFPATIPFGVASAEIYDPSTGLFSPTGSMIQSRATHTAMLLSNGKVLVIGGSTSSDAELYNPTEATFSLNGSVAKLFLSTVTLLSNGKVLLAGGIFRLDLPLLNIAFLYDPITGTGSLTGGITGYSHTATLLSNGKVLVAGGTIGGGGFGNFADLYDPATGIFSPTGNTITGHVGHTSTLLPNGEVLIAGANPELYDPAIGTFSPTGSVNTIRGSHTSTLLQNGEVLITGGSGESGALASAELFR
jgi:hypothetical protein